MHEFAVRCRRSFKRYSEPIAILAFILTDCFASGWMLIAGTAAAIIYVIVPAAATLLRLSAIEQVTFLKAYVKTQKVQQIALLLFWLYSIRLLVFATSSSGLFTVITEDNLPSLSSALVLGAQQFAPLAFLATPVFFYAVACGLSILLRTRHKPTKKDPDLIQQRQRWCGSSQVLFLSAFIGGILSITMNVSGPAYMVSNWLLASARDANLFVSPAEKSMDTFNKTRDNAGANVPEPPPEIHELPKPMMALQNAPVQPTIKSAQTASDTKARPPQFIQDPLHAGRPNSPQLQGVTGPGTESMSFVQPFDTFIIAAVSGIIFTVLLKPALRLNALLSSFCWRVVSPWSLQNYIEAFLEALRLPARSLAFNEAHPLVGNAVRTLGWLLLCYGALFWIFGFSGGPLGEAIHSWMIASAMDAGFRIDNKAPEWLFQPPLRIFLGSIVALYGTAPIAITAAIFLPCAMARKLTINCDGILFSQGPYLTLLGRQFRLWSDLKSMVVTVAKTKGGMKAKFTLSFRSTGSVAFTNSQMSVSDLRVLIDGIDEHASNCEVDPQVYEVCRTLAEIEGDVAISDGIDNTSISTIATEEFKSTIFVPLIPGAFLPGTQIRIIKQLSSKPLCAVYLARDDSGRMLTVKQFYLASDDEETRALTKIFQREYELLSNLDHPGIAKIVNSLEHERSTFLLIEHRLGSDMRDIVKEHGPRSEATTVEWARQIARIMLYLHAREPAVTHRDLTPDNVIVGEDGQLRLIDFGAAREFLEGITGTMLGKHCYVSPEQLRGEATPRSDIYSFGGTLYYLLTGRDPVALSQSSPAKLVDCSDSLDLLIRRCTEFDEDKRPRSFEEVLDALSEMNAGFRLKIPAVIQKAPA
ncbi:MAG: serine/threonine protein kinase [Candidatus Obscuribacterales bacterium]|nr:serine/threonine protein kinase [Candidatus Obscuribacterales bacterium]